MVIGTYKLLLLSLGTCCSTKFARKCVQHMSITGKVEILEFQRVVDELFYVNSNVKMNHENRNQGLRFTDIFLQLFCEKNSDGTKKLRMKGNEFQQRFNERMFPADMVHVCDFLKNHSEINEVDFSYNPVEDEGLETLCHITLKHPNNIEHINMTHCDVSNLGVKTLYYVAQEGFVKLKTLRLCGNKIGPLGGQIIALTIPHIPTLEYLDLGDTNQVTDSVEYILQQVYFSSIKILNISRLIPKTSLQIVNDTFLAADLSELLRLNQGLVELHVQKCNLDGHDMEILIAGLKENKSLKFLDLGYNHICCVGLEYLSQWLKTRPALLGLNVAGNYIGNHGAIALSFAMPFSKLRYLDISYNKIKDEGIVAVLTSIKKPYLLRYFLIWGNQLGQRSLKIIARMMLSQVFEQRGIDVKIYEVDGVLCAARYTVEKYKHRYYDVMDYGCATELKIKRNKIENPDDRPRALLNFKHIDRYPPLEK